LGKDIRLLSLTLKEWCKIRKYSEIFMKKENPLQMRTLFADDGTNKNIDAGIDGDYQLALGLPTFDGMSG
jgi:hypothetical protein